MPSRVSSTAKARAALIRSLKKPRRRSKYGATRTQFGGYSFDSKAEASRYQELKLLESQFVISGLKVHPRYELSVWDGLKRIIIGHYELDFEYVYDLNVVYEDVKGFMTPLSRWKIKHFEAQYDCQVRLIRKTKKR